MAEIKVPVDYNKLTWQEKRKVRERYIQLQRGLCFTIVVSR